MAGEEGGGTPEQMGEKVYLGLACGWGEGWVPPVKMVKMVNIVKMWPACCSLEGVYLLVKIVNIVKMVKLSFFTKTVKKLVFVDKNKTQKNMKLGKRVTGFHKNCEFNKKL